jgi:hypothetical protein
MPSLPILSWYGFLNQFVVRINKEESEGIIKILLAMYHGLVIQLLSNPEKIEDEKIWLPIRKMLLSSLK